MVEELSLCDVTKHCIITGAEWPREGLRLKICIKKKQITFLSLINKYKLSNISTWKLSTYSRNSSKLTFAR